jgi:hypothetical protein
MKGLQSVVDRLRIEPVAQVWGPPEQVPDISLPMAVIRRARQLPPPPTGTPGPFSLADAGVVERVFTQGGFTAVQTERLTVTLEYASAEEFIRERQATAANLRAMLADVPAPEQVAIWRAVADAVGPYADAEGVIRLSNETVCVVGQSASG